MGKATRYTEEMINEYAEKGFWTRELTVDFWDRNSEHYPDQEAIVDSRGRLTWSQARRKYDGMALHLLELGLEKDDVLLAQAYNCVDLVLIRLACEKAGILLALIPYTFRHSEAEAVLKKVEAKGAFIPYEYRGFNYLEMFKEIRTRVPKLKYIFVFGGLAPEGTISLNEMTRQTLDDGNPHYAFTSTNFEPFGFEEILTTSGSTGIPKCVEWTGCARLAHGREAIKRLSINQKDIICPLHNSISGAAELLSYRSAPQAAAKTVMLEHFSPDEACKLIQKEKVTIAVVVPTIIVQISNYADLHKHDISSLRMLVSSAAVLPYEVAKEAEEKIGCPIVQAYGTMDSGGVAMHSIDEPPEVRFRTLGKPLAGNEVKIKDSDGNEVPPGEIGVITVRGPYSIGGYYKDREMTQRVWKGGRIILGDLGRVDEQGRIQMMGRQTDVIIRGGQNIYPSEIESLLARHPKILEVVIVKMPDPLMGEKACACVVPCPNQVITFEEMVSFLKEKQIAPFKIPERLETMNNFPLVPGGNKVDKREIEAEIAQGKREKN